MHNTRELSSLMAAKARAKRPFKSVRIFDVGKKLERVWALVP